MTHADTMRDYLLPFLRCHGDSHETRLFVTQGEERGSHYMMLVPKPVPEAVAAVEAVGWRQACSSPRLLRQW